MTETYSFTDRDVHAAFSSLTQELFDNKERNYVGDGVFKPQMLIVAGAQGAGKTFLLENVLLKDGKYANYVRLYKPHYRELHPHYERMKDKGVLHVYDNTERFIWRLGEMICTYAMDNHYSLIMETALDNLGFAAFPPEAAKKGYQAEVHLIACQKEFSHWSTLDRAVTSVADEQLERVVSLTQIEEAQINARSIIDAFENACTQVLNSEIVIYQRGLETDKSSRPVCYSVCTEKGVLTPQGDYKGTPFFKAPHLKVDFKVLRSPASDFPCSYIQYAQVVHAGLLGTVHRRAMAELNCKTLGLAHSLMTKLPVDVYRELCLYVLKYAQL
ncbi:zeta toxin family protein [Pseudomonas putida]|uniref:zeta toxin family protein n=1 Tax=Pseudomonas putida TaxID=303 RepID=UPI0021F8CD2E|nr:zeta toxin family protein [Pseudomonas putida]